MRTRVRPRRGAWWEAGRRDGAGGQQLSRLWLQAWPEAGRKAGLGQEELLVLLSLGCVWEALWTLGSSSCRGAALREETYQERRNGLDIPPAV